MSFDMGTASTTLLDGIEALEREVQMVYSNLVLPGWVGPLHGYQHTLYGYMMVCFGRIDRVSAHWRGTTSDQSPRMIQFMEKYLSREHEACSLAVQIWRHKLMHTGEPRSLCGGPDRIVYCWLLHWGEHLPIEQHFTFSSTAGAKVLNLALLYLIGDLKAGVQTYLNDLARDRTLQQNFVKVETGMRKQRYRRY